ATGGDAALGGDDFDRTIAGWIQEQSGAVADADYGALLRVARQAKHALSEAEHTPVCWCDWQGVLDRDTLYACIEPLIDKTLRACRRVLRGADLEPADISDVVLVGGATRSPRVQEKVAAFFERQPLCSLDPD